MKKELSFCILSAGGMNRNNTRLIEEIEKRKHSAELIHPEDLYAYISPAVSGYDAIYRKSDEGPDRKVLKKDFDVLIPRVAGQGVFEYACVMTEHFERHKHIFSTASSWGLRLASNKLYTAQRLSQCKIRTIKQVFARNPNDYKFITDLVDGSPIVCKTQTGSQGNGVFILEGELPISTTLKSLSKSGIEVIIQKYINSGTPKSDLRIYVIGSDLEDPKIFAYRRLAVDEDFRSNYSISGKGEKVKITDEEKDMAIRACKALGLRIAAVDIIRDADNKDTPYLVEVNGNGSLTGIETVTGENVAGAIIDYCIENYLAGPYVSDSMNSVNPASLEGRMFLLVGMEMARKKYVADYKIDLAIKDFLIENRLPETFLRDNISEALTILKLR